MRVLSATDNWNPVYHEHTRHFGTWPIGREKIDIKVKYVHTDDQLEDFLTKMVSRGKSSYALHYPS